MKFKFNKKALLSVALSAGMLAVSGSMTLVAGMYSARKADYGKGDYFRKFAACIMCGELERVKELKTNGFLDSCGDGDRESFVDLALSCMNKDVLLLVSGYTDNKVDIINKVYHKKSLLLWAIAHKDVEFVRELVCNNAKVCSHDGAENALLCTIKQEGMPEDIKKAIICELLLNGCDIKECINERDSKLNMTALEWAVHNKYIEIIELLLNNGASTNLLNTEIFQDVHLTGDTEFLNFLQKRGITFHLVFKEAVISNRGTCDVTHTDIPEEGVRSERFRRSQIN